MRNLLKPLFQLLILIAIFPSQVYGQDVDHVYLKNGSVIRGQIIEIEPMNHVKIQDLCGNIWYYNSSEVEKISSEPFTAPGFEEEKAGFDAGFVNMTSIGFLAGSSNNMQTAPFSLLMVNGWRNSFGLFMGMGLGIEFLNTNYLPLFMDLRYDLTGKDVVPYLMARGGYTLPISSGYTDYDIEYTYEGGPMMAIGVGLKI